MDGCCAGVPLAAVVPHIQLRLDSALHSGGRVPSSLPGPGMSLRGSSPSQQLVTTDCLLIIESRRHL